MGYNRTSPCGILPVSYIVMSAVRSTSETAVPAFVGSQFCSIGSNRALTEDHAMKLVVLAFWEIGVASETVIAIQAVRIALP